MAFKNKIDIRILNVMDTRASNWVDIIKKINLKDKIIEKTLDKIYINALNRAYIRINKKADLKNWKTLDRVNTKAINRINTIKRLNFWDSEAVKLDSGANS